MPRLEDEPALETRNPLGWPRFIVLSPGPIPALTAAEFSVGVPSGEGVPAGYAEAGIDAGGLVFRFCHRGTLTDLVE